MKTEVTQEMIAEHRLILRMIALVEKSAERLARGEFRNWRFFLDAVAFIRDYADRFHHAKEEAVLFTALVKNGMPEKQSPIEAMLMEHDAGRAHVRGMEEATQRALAGDDSGIPALLEHARGYAKLLRGHINKEDTILYPLAERVLPEEMRPAMLDAYRAAEARAPELAETYRRMVEDYEQEILS
ncbi:hemerythrin domain-containing protein [Trichloromonas sp.]|uniref:hemerythrin domain-containing protein n=1 Tax=Trichloromonas sp. TaxID=3069249 RepID=UPI002A3CBAFC|nr:hemerythrin domain-containing protein [Trichloromonas sp.]